MILLALVVLLIAIPVAEIFVIIKVGEAIGVLPTIALLLADALVGAWLIRSQGRAAWRRFNQALAEGRVPAREVLDGVLVIFGGALLIAPGFLTDIVGAVFLFPPTRALLRRRLVRRMTRGLWGVGWRRFGSSRSARSRRRGDDGDVEGTAVEVENRDLLP
ncbi:MAG TPA: FxsA family protein [Solirubrobacteraceae bacterium]|nr:FxsA family protein [Solirubrobacteraceae bacterium]